MYPTKQGVTVFQSTHPLRGATNDNQRDSKRRRFQSTHPLRGATMFNANSSDGQLISIHAPLAGCDLVIWLLVFWMSYFNPRTPCGVRRCRHLILMLGRKFQSTHPLRGATRSAVLHIDISKISIHAPLAGCDRVLRYVGQQRIISIYAPLAGCDVGMWSRPSSTRYFNPRTPCGVRPDRRMHWSSSKHFNPRTPCGVRLPEAVPRWSRRNFNPRTPCGVRLSSN